ncbi:hypothetical protein JB92DRAFT_3126870 [Gautieria morchelliformis]|nr:hypothetical protein JB92DRAFT_3126870 [Gautieria morchelliformis]
MSSGSVEDIIVLGGQLQATRAIIHPGDQLYDFSDCRISIALFQASPFCSMSISSHLEMKFGTFGPTDWFAVLSREVFDSLDVLNSNVQKTRYYVPISLSVITAALTTTWGEAAAGCPVSLLILYLKLQNSIDDFNDSVYALYNRNKWILGYLSSIVAIQSAGSICVSTFPGRGPLLMPPIDIAAFQGCFFLASARLKNGEYVATILELMYGASIVGLIMAKGWKDRSLNGLRDRGGILRVIVKDGIIYFLVIFSTMFIWLCVGLFAPLGLKFVNAYPSEVLVSIMINRLTINLHRSVKGNHGTSLTLAGSSSDIDNGVIDDLGDQALSHESQGIELEKFHPRDDELNSQL